MTSPWSSPRMVRRSTSRESSRLSVIPDWEYSTRSVHPRRGLGSQQPLVRRSGQLLFGFRAFTFRSEREDRDCPGLLVEFQHRQNMKTFGVVDLDTQDDEIRAYSL